MAAGPSSAVEILLPATFSVPLWAPLLFLLAVCLVGLALLIGVDRRADRCARPATVKAAAGAAQIVPEAPVMTLAPVYKRKLPKARAPVRRRAPAVAGFPHGGKQRRGVLVTP